jgi:hypothetical protein
MSITTQKIIIIISGFMAGCVFIAGIITVLLLSCTTTADREKCKMLEENFFYRQDISCEEVEK